jgi:hypothetical protein
LIKYPKRLPEPDVLLGCEANDFIGVFAGCGVVSRMHVENRCEVQRIHQARAMVDLTPILERALNVG